jgi:hypothetical protein
MASEIDVVATCCSTVVCCELFLCTHGLVVSRMHLLLINRSVTCYSVYELSEDH